MLPESRNERTALVTAEILGKNILIQTEKVLLFLIQLN
jgi:hypothetical protein